MRHPQIASLVLAAGLTIDAEKAHAYDIDCAIMLCMAGGFPSSSVCSAAYAEMIRRITPWPSRPPFGVCTYAAVPVALGGPGRQDALDISTPDYEWLRRTRVLWWRGRSYKPRDDSRQWDWSIRSCDHENKSCHYIVHVYGSHSPWPAFFTSENGQNIPTPGSSGLWATYSRAVMMEYGDYEAKLDHSSWINY